MKATLAVLVTVWTVVKQGMKFGAVIAAATAVVTVIGWLTLCVCHLMEAPLVSQYLGLCKWYQGKKAARAAKKAAGKRPSPRRRPQRRSTPYLRAGVITRLQV